MALPGRFGAVVTAMATPFDPDGRLDLDGVARLARYLVEHSSEALVVAGTTGEGVTLTDQEKADLWRACVEAVTVPVIAGAGTNDTHHSVALTRLAAEVGAAGILAVTPYYNRPSQAGIDAHFRAVAGATDLPVILYDIPVRTGRKASTDTILGLARSVPNVVAVKDAAGDVAGSARLLADAPPGFELYSGEDGLTLPLLSVGAAGVVSVASHWAGPVFAEMMRCVADGDLPGARAANTRLLESYTFQTGELAPNPVPLKAVLRVLGLPAGECRLPMGPTPAGLEDQARAVLERLGALSSRQGQPSVGGRP
ncbi:MAG: 4-hydroxy-tetrahydrodipicolinate synthase [Acidimicrobiales bacterium]|nr:4-hydroxy-tetrahydrodipicolinate synthase [Acidimicrobiales bacterium]MBO0893885.1 4-hydroxy-tetrahydrodipicolinate synthase [Acidimicrobiales bacterium]